MNFIQYSIAHLRQGTRNPERGDVSSNLVCNLHHFQDEPRNKKAAQSSPREKDGAKGGSEATHFTQEESPGLGGSEATHFTQEESPGLGGSEAAQFAQGRSPGEDGSQGTDAYGRSIGSGALNFNRHQCYEVSGHVSFIKGRSKTLPRKGRHKLTPPLGGRHELH